MIKKKRMGNESIVNSNQFIKFAVGGTSHNRRLLTNNDIMKIHNVEIAVPIMSQPICEHCERVCIWHSESDMWGNHVPLGVCQHCGTITRNPLTYGEYLANGHDIPDTVVGNDRIDSIKARQWLNALFNIDGKDKRDEIFE